MNVSLSNRIWVLSLLLLLGASTAFADAASDKAERARIDRERAAAEQSFRAKDQECRQHFVVTTCVDAAQRDRREVLKRLRVQQELLDEAARRERATQRLESIRQKESGADAKQREAMARQQQKRLPAGAAASSSAPGSSLVPAPAASRPPSTRLPRAPSAALPRTSPASAAERAGNYVDRQQDVADHREEVARRHAERLAKGKKAVPLPLPESIPGSAPKR